MKALLAVVAALVFAAAWIAVAHGHTHGLDRAGFDVLALSRNGWAAEAAPTVVDVAEVVLALCVAGMLGVLALRRAWQRGIAILAGLFVGQLVAHLVKDAVARPRPPHELVTAGGWSFPSTTSALGTVFIFLAIALAEPLEGPRRTVIQLSGVVIAGLLGVSFVALRVHYLSDVIAGLALGVLAFLACEAGAGVVAGRLSRR